METKFALGCMNAHFLYRLGEAAHEDASKMNCITSLMKSILPIAVIQSTESSSKPI